MLNATSGSGPLEYSVRKSFRACIVKMGAAKAIVVYLPSILSWWLSNQCYQLLPSLVFVLPFADNLKSAKVGNYSGNNYLTHFTLRHAIR